MARHSVDVLVKTRNEARRRFGGFGKVVSAKVIIQAMDEARHRFGKIDSIRTMV